MSRSRKKAIIKDVGHRKEDYWRVHRRVNDSNLKHWIESSRRLSAHNFVIDEFKEFDYLKNKYILDGHGELKAEYDAWEDLEFDLSFSTSASNLFRYWWEEPEFKRPKELVNDYDYKDWVLDYEYGWGYSFYMSQDNYTGNNDWKEKFRRK